MVDSIPNFRTIVPGTSRCSASVLINSVSRHPPKIVTSMRDGFLGTAVAE
jgi:hypothetical protein